MKERKELRESQKAWEKEKSEMSERLSRLENTPKTEDEINNMTPQEAIAYAEEKMKREYESKSTLTEREEKEAEQYIEETLSDLKDA
jgi:C-terminal processing protease CtpA/Prc